MGTRDLGEDTEDERIWCSKQGGGRCKTDWHERPPGGVL